jgi:hypothetical protein
VLAAFVFDGNGDHEDGVNDRHSPPRRIRRFGPEIGGP